MLQPKRATRILLFSVMLLAVASLLTLPVQSDQARLPLLAGAEIDPAVLKVMQRSCQDCHSEATYYPWYAYVAPASFLIKSDVNRGRERLNLSRWNEYPLVRKERSLSEIANQVKDHEMPLWQYTLLHPGARLSESDMNAIFRWTQAERSRLIAESQR